MAVSETIYQMVLDGLHVTHTPDTSTASRLRNEIASGMEFITKYCNPEADFSPGTRFGQMLCDYVLRCESGDVETFAADFSEDITACKVESDVEAYVEAMFNAQT